MSDLPDTLRKMAMVHASDCVVDGASIEAANKLARESTCWKAADEIERLEELEGNNTSLTTLLEISRAMRGHIITTAQIDAAVEYANLCHKNGFYEPWIALNKLGIVRCEGCDGGMYLAAKYTTQCGVSLCPDCEGKGWVKT